MTESGPEHVSEATAAPQRSGRWARVVRRLPVLATGGYAWAATVVPGAWGDSAPVASRWAAALALVVLVTAVLVRQGRWSVLLGVEGFASACLVSWWLVRTGGASVRPSFFGIFGWIAYTLAWGALSKPISQPHLQASGAAPGSRLPGRAKPRWTVMFGILPALALTPLLLVGPLLIERDWAAVLGLVVSLALLLAFVQVGSDVGSALYAQRPGTTAGARLRRSASLLVALVGLLVGLYYWRLHA